MTLEQRRAWFVVGVFLLSCAAAVVLGCLAGIGRAPAGFGLFGLVLGQFLFRKRAAPGEVTADERDEAIAEKATAAGGLASYTMFVLACMIPWFILTFRGRKMIDVDALARIVAAGAVAYFTVRAVAILVLYRQWGSRSDG